MVINNGTFDMDASILHIDDIKTNELISVEQATICLIDICGFSKWCVNRVPNQIVETMKEYNEFINRQVEQYEGLTKIELVGDCCMVVGGMIPSMNRQLCTRTVVQFAVCILKELQTVRNIFNDIQIGLRIGIHMADVFGVMLQKPRRFQLYSNDINVCSRLESNAIRNTIHISLKTVLSNEDLMTDYNDLYIISPLNEREYKGVGQVSSYTFHIRRSELLWFDTTMCSIQVPMSECKDVCENVYVINNIPDLFQRMYSFVWQLVIIHCSSESILETIQNELIAFREWERDREPQMIVLVCDFPICARLSDMCVVVKNFKEIRRHTLFNLSNPPNENFGEAPWGERIHFKTLDT